MKDSSRGALPDGGCATRLAGNPSAWLICDVVTPARESPEAISLGPLFDGDAILARSLRERDRQIDQMNHAIADNLTRKMAELPDRIPDYLQLLFIARHFARVGDHAKNIGEDAVYTAEAEDIRHPDNAMAYF